MTFAARIRTLFDGRGLLATFRDMLLADRQAEIENDPDATARALREALVGRIRICRRIEIERNCFREILIDLGYSPQGLMARVEKFDAELKADVKARRF